MEAKAAEWERLGADTGGLLDVAELSEADRWLSSPDAVEVGYAPAVPALVAASRTALAAIAERDNDANARELAQANALLGDQRHRVAVQQRATRQLGILVGVFATAQQRSARNEANARATEVVIRTAAEGAAQSNADLAATRAAEAVACRTLLASASASSDDTDHTVRLWRIATPGTAPQVLRGHSNAVTAVAWSPDGSTIASSSGDGSVRLWQPAAPALPPIVLRGAGGIVYGVAWRPDGAEVVSANADGALIIWQAQRATLSEAVCNLVGHNLSLADWRYFVGELPYQRTCPNLPAGDGAPPS